MTTSPTPRSARSRAAASFLVLAVSATAGAATDLRLAQNAAPDKAPAAAPAVALPAWTFAGAQADGWTAERGTLTATDGAVRLKPDANRRVVLISPPALPEGVRNAEAFVVHVDGTGLTRVRVQGRRDARGGWITLADAGGAELAATPDGYVVKRVPGARDAPIERLRIELTFRTTNARTLRSLALR